MRLRSAEREKRERRVWRCIVVLCSPSLLLFLPYKTAEMQMRIISGTLERTCAGVSICMGMDRWKTQKGKQLKTIDRKVNFPLAANSGQTCIKAEMKFGTRIIMMVFDLPMDGN